MFKIGGKGGGRGLNLHLFLIPLIGKYLLQYFSFLMIIHNVFRL